MRYVIIPLKGPGDIDLIGVRFGDKSFIYWRKLSTSNIGTVVVIFNKEHENIAVQDNLILSLKGLTNYQDLSSAIEILLQITGISKVGVRFHFIVGNENQRQVAESLGRQFGFSYSVQMDQVDIQRNIGSMSNGVGANLNVVGASGNTNGVSGSSLFGNENTYGDGYTNDVVNIANEGKIQNSGKVLYIDWENNMLITDEDGKVHGNIGVDGFGYDAESGIITRYGEFYAHDGGKRKVIPFKLGSSVGKVRKRDTGSYRSAAFVSLPVIMFVLSALLLIGSVILLFVID